MSVALRDGSHVCIVGGGPSGSFAALHLLRLARAEGLSLDVTIFEPRDFRQRGPAGCNRCAGILSSRLLAGLAELGVSPEPEIIRSYIRAYEVHVDGDSFLMEAPIPAREIVSVYRGAGPRLAPNEGGPSFDGFLLEQACARGARLIPNRVHQVTWDETVVHAGSRIPADLVVPAASLRPPRSPLQIPAADDRRHGAGRSPPPVGLAQRCRPHLLSDNRSVLSSVR
jgi:flavin-dependent dehydrogenase